MAWVCAGLLKMMSSGRRRNSVAALAEAYEALHMIVPGVAYSRHSNPNHGAIIGWMTVFIAVSLAGMRGTNVRV